MSSSTRIRVTTVRVSDADAFSPERILGAGGTALLRETLAQLPQIRAENPEVADRLDWVRVAGERDVWATTVEGVDIVLRLGRSRAEVAYASTVSVAAGTRAALSERHRVAVSRKTNQLLAVALGQRATRLLSKSAPAVKTGQHVKAWMRLDRQMTVRARMQVRVTA